MPKWGLSMQEGRIVQWLKREGDSVEKDEPLLEVETEKLVSVVESPTAGIVGRILHPEDTTLAVGEVIALITEPGEAVPDPSEGNATPESASVTTPSATTPSATVTSVVASHAATAAVPDGVVRAMPAARRIARERGLDLSAVQGTGPEGVIVVADVEDRHGAIQLLQKVTFYSEGIRLDGLVYTPDDLTPGERRPALVLCVGYTYLKSLVMPDIAHVLNEAGYVAMIFDYRGFGDSDGERWRLIPREQVNDVRAAVTYLGSLPQVDADNMGLLGISLGGAHAIVAGAAENRVAAVVAIEPVGDGERWLSSLRRHWEWLEFEDRLKQDRLQRARTGTSTRVDPLQIVVPDPDSETFLQAVYNEYPQMHCDLPLETADALLEYCPEAHVGMIAPRPLLLIHGDADRQVAADESHSIFEAAGEPRYLEIVPGMGHFDWVMAGSDGFRRVMDLTLGFLQEHLPAQ